MILPDLAAALLLLAVTAYAVLGGADFGAGFWDLTAGGAERGSRVRGLVKRSMGPVWEANHVWLIFVLVVMWTAFPAAFAAIMSTLYVPLFGALVGIVLRGSAFALRGEAATISEARLMGAAFALSSVAVPFFFGATVGGVASGRVPEGTGGGDALTSWTGPTSILVGLLSVATGAYLAAVFMTGDATRAGLPDLVAAFRRRAIGAAVVAGALALAGLVVVHSDAPHLYDGLTSGGGLAAVIGSALAGLATLALLLRGHYEAARFGSAFAVGAVVLGWWLAQRPDFLPGQLSFEDAAAGDSTLLALLISVGVGMLILLPSLWLLFRLTLKGKLDQDFHPIGASDPHGDQLSTASAPEAER
ncbi:cytochrome d ubiquinol oxidase subunit II [soil metagenome]